ncbi:MAG: ABC transporter permease [Ruminococcaceae bacterium]|nr:ABC transporter permease [Oscillospiraceae bacterium]
MFYFIGQALHGLFRNGVMTFASIAVLMSCLIVTGGFSLLVLNIDLNLEQFDLLKEIVVFCPPLATEEEVTAVGEQIKKLDNVANVERVTKAEALADVKEESDVYDDVTEEQIQDYMPESFVITYIDNERVSTLDYQLKQIEGIYKVNNRLDLASTIESLKSGVMLIFIWFLAVLMLVSVFIIVNTVKLSVFARRNEISIMRYVGATGWFITLPFIFEGIIIGLIASVAGYFVEWYVYGYIEKMMTTDLQMISIVGFGSISHIVLAAFIGVGVATGIVGSMISLGKYLNK